MWNSEHEELSARKGVPRLELDAVFVLRFLRIDDGVVDVHFQPVAAQLGNKIRDFGIAKVRAVFLEGKPGDDRFRAVRGEAGLRQALHRHLGDEARHAVVDAPPGEDRLGLVAEHLGSVRQVIGIDADAVAAHKAGMEREEVRLGGSGAQHLAGVDAHAVEDDRELVHQRDVQVTLRVLDHLGGLGDADAARAVHAGERDLRIELRDALEGFRTVARDDLRNGAQPVGLVAGVDALGGVADVEVLAPAHAGGALERGHAVFLGAARIHGRFDDHRRPALHVAARRFHRGKQQAQVGPVRRVDRRGHGDDQEVRLAQGVRIAGNLELARRSELFGGHFAGGVAPLLEARDLAVVAVVADGRAGGAEGHRQRQPDVTQSDDGDFHL